MMRPLLRFFRLEAASGILLLAAAGVALVLANSPLAGGYRAISGALLGLVNDGLMAIFFLLVGMEVKHELVAGELRSFGRAVLPAIAALGGMLAPAIIFWLLNPSGIAARGWAIPMATDIAFAMGVLALLKGRVPAALVVFVTALAIFDDIGGIAVIAVYYGRGIAWLWLAGAIVVIGVLVAIARAGVRSVFVYLLFGPVLWVMVDRSGIHPALAGVALGLCIPSGKRGSAEETPELAERRDAQSPLSSLIDALHPPVAFGIMPLFALVNAGVSLHGLHGSSLESTVLLGAALGLFLGKQIGVFTFTLGAAAVGISPMPEGASRGSLYGASIVAGIGFTVALFIADLAFSKFPELLLEAKLGIFLGSLASGIAGLLVLRFASRPAGQKTG